MSTTTDGCVHGRLTYFRASTIPHRFGLITGLCAVFGFKSGQIRPRTQNLFLSVVKFLQQSTCTCFQCPYSERRRDRNVHTNMKCRETQSVISCIYACTKCSYAYAYAYTFDNLSTIGQESHACPPRLNGKPQSNRAAQSHDHGQRYVFMHQ